MTIVNEANVELAFKGFKSIYTTAYLQAPVHYTDLAMTVTSGARDEAYGWLGQMPQMREWLSGERVVKQLEAHGFTIENRKFESTVGIKREDFADDRLGIYKPMFQDMGETARQHPDQLIFELLASGFTETCFDGQYYFDADHPSVDKGGNTISVSNVQDGAGPSWFLLDTSRAIKPMIWQEREPYDFQFVNRPNDYNVFMTDNFVFGGRARVNAGFGLWQLAFGSKADLDPFNYGNARAAMMGYRGDQGRLLGIRPDTLVVPPSLELRAFDLLNSAFGEGGASNAWKGSAKVLVCPHLEG